jgi:DNA-binding beta-propeller fold protein YncE
VGDHDPAAVSSDGTHVWVTSNVGNSVTELNATTGALVRSIRGFAFAFGNPTAVSSDGTDVWVTSPFDQSVTGFSPSG